MYFKNNLLAVYTADSWQFILILLLVIIIVYIVFSPFSAGDRLYTS